MISMVALLIAIGLLMDDAIVISENIATHLSKGKKPIDAAVDGIREVAAGVISSFLTTVFVFGSLATISGTMGKILRVIPIVLIIVLIVSLIEAFFILPNHLAHSLKNNNISSKNRIKTKLNNIIEWIKNKLVGKFSSKVIMHRYLFIGILVSIFIISIGMIAGGILKFRVFPDLDSDIIAALVLLPQGTPLAKTENIVNQLTDALKKTNQHFTPEQPNCNNLVKNISVQYNTNTDAGESGAHVCIRRSIITCTYSMLGIVAFGNGGTKQAVENGNIEKVKMVEMEIRNYCHFWISYNTVAYGN